MNTSRMLAFVAAVMITASLVGAFAYGLTAAPRAVAGTAAGAQSKAD
ncbi:MAG TPA: hypothetical protein VKG63_15995 [Steroidobacteraceae bacterium]|nr:hypothetical protein [Steroidobacteraceae bacterium]